MNIKKRMNVNIDKMIKIYIICDKLRRKETFLGYVFNFRMKIPKKD